jgi:hypothetical protein
MTMAIYNSWQINKSDKESCSEAFLHGHKYKCIVFGHTHIKNFFLKRLNHFIIKFFFIIRKNIFMCVSKHCTFIFVTMIDFLSCSCVGRDNSSCAQRTMIVASISGRGSLLNKDHSPLRTLHWRKKK